MSARIDPFANLKEPPVFTTKPKKETAVEEEAIEHIAKQNNFPSRQAPRVPKEPRRKPRIYRTGRNQQFNAKATPETIQRFYKAADERHVPLGELMKQALDALDSVDHLQKIADKNDLSLDELVKQALNGFERVGASGAIGVRTASAGQTGQQKSDAGSVRSAIEG